MIDLYTWATPNGRKVSIMLEELGVEYHIHPIDLSKNEQFDAEFVAINPYSKIPAIIDSDGPNGTPITLFESGAILLYLAEKYQRFIAQDGLERYRVIQWLMFQMGNIGPMFGQAHHFRRFAQEQVPYGIARYTNEAKRIYATLETHLGNQEFFAGEYSVADIATYPWIARHEWHAVDLNDYPNVYRWFHLIGSRPAVNTGMRIPN